MSVTTTRRRAGRRLEQLVEVRDVGVAVDRDVGLRQPAAVDDARVVELVGEHDVVRPGQRRDRADVREVARTRTAPRPRSPRTRRARPRVRGAAGRPRHEARRAGAGAPPARRRSRRPRERADRPRARGSCSSTAGRRVRPSISTSGADAVSTTRGRREQPGAPPTRRARPATQSRSLTSVTSSIDVARDGDEPLEVRDRHRERRHQHDHVAERTDDHAVLPRVQDHAVPDPFRRVVGDVALEPSRARCRPSSRAAGSRRRAGDRAAARAASRAPLRVRGHRRRVSRSPSGRGSQATPRMRARCPCRCVRGRTS